MSSDPKNINALIDKGITLQRIGKTNQSIKYFDKALKINPKNIDGLIGKGSALHALGKFSDAISCYDTILEINSKFPVALAY